MYTNIHTCIDLKVGKLVSLKKESFLELREKSGLKPRKFTRDETCVQLPFVHCIKLSLPLAWFLLDLASFILGLCVQSSAY